MPDCADSPSASLGADNDAERRYCALRDRAYRLLARREHSAWELRRKLEASLARSKRWRDASASANADDDTDASVARDDVQQMLDRLLAELIERGAQSDARFAEHLCRWRYQSGRGPVKLRHDLSQHRINDALIEQAMAEYAPKWSALAAQVRERKFGARAPESYHEWAKQARFLRQRGFATEQIEPYS